MGSALIGADTKVGLTIHEVVNKLAVALGMALPVIRDTDDLRRASGQYVAAIAELKQNEAVNTDRMQAAEAALTSIGGELQQQMHRAAAMEMIIRSIRHVLKGVTMLLEEEEVGHAGEGQQPA